MELCCAREAERRLERKVRKEKNIERKLTIIGWKKLDLKEEIERKVEISLLKKGCKKIFKKGLNSLFKKINTEKTKAERRSE